MEAHPVAADSHEVSLPKDAPFQGDAIKRCVAERCHLRPAVTHGRITQLGLDKLHPGQPSAVHHDAGKRPTADGRVREVAIFEHGVTEGAVDERAAAEVCIADGDCVESETGRPDILPVSPDNLDSNKLLAIAET